MLALYGHSTNERGPRQPHQYLDQRFGRSPTLANTLGDRTNAKRASQRQHTGRQ